MTGPEIIAVVLNIAVGLMLAVYYPRFARRQLSNASSVPRGFQILIKVAPIIGWLIVLLSVFYTLVRLSGALDG